MDILPTLELLYSEMFNHSIKNKIVELRSLIDLQGSINKLYDMNRLDDIVKIYNINRCVRLFEPQELLDAIGCNSDCNKVLAAI